MGIGEDTVVDVIIAAFGDVDVIVVDVFSGVDVIVVDVIVPDAFGGVDEIAVAFGVGDVIAVKAFGGVDVIIVDARPANVVACSVLVGAQLLML